MARGSADEHDVRARLKPPDTMDDADAQQWPARHRILGDSRHLRLRHGRIMFQLQRHQAITPAHYAGEAGDPAASQRLQRGQFTRDVEILRLDRDPFHPPVTGGNSAISRALPIGVSSGANRWSIAARSRAGSPSACA